MDTKQKQTIKGNIVCGQDEGKLNRSILSCFMWWEDKGYLEYSEKRDNDAASLHKFEEITNGRARGIKYNGVTAIPPLSFNLK